MSADFEFDIDEPIHRHGGANWCFMCDSPSDSDVEYLNFANFSGAFNITYLCEEHLWEVLAEQEEHSDILPSFIPIR